MRVAVTGASGFVGRHVLHALRGKAEVVAVSRTGRLPADETATALALDIGEAGRDVFERLGRPDVLVHLAWGGLPHYRSPTHLEHELPRQRAFLDACLDGGLRRLVVAGTCLEYGMQSGALAEWMPTHPDTAYAQAKDQLRRHLESRPDRAAFGLAWLRLFYVFGPGQMPGSLYSQLHAAVDAGATRFAMSPGDQLRDFIAIEQAAALIVRIALEHADPGVVNIGSGVPATVEDTVRRWLAGRGAALELDKGVHPYNDHEPFAFWSDTTRLHALLEST